MIEINNDNNKGAIIISKVYIFIIYDVIVNSEDIASANFQYTRKREGKRLRLLMTYRHYVSFREAKGLKTLQYISTYLHDLHVSSIFTNIAM